MLPKNIGKINQIESSTNDTEVTALIREVICKVRNIPKNLLPYGKNYMGDIQFLDEKFYDFDEKSYDRRKMPEIASIVLKFLRL